MSAHPPESSSVESGQRLEPTGSGDGNPIPQARRPQTAFDLVAPPFRFDGGAGSYIGVGILSALLTVLTLGIAYPWAVCMSYRWRAEHTLVYGRRVHFTGTGGRLFGTWIKWLVLIIITIGIYSFWVAPRLTRWIVEHQDFS